MYKRSFAATTLCLLAAFSTPSLADDMKQPRVISLSGHGEVRVAPTLATVSLGVFKNAPTAAEALAANTSAMKELFAALKAAGVADTDMQTSNFSVNPRYEYRNDSGQPVANGFDVSNSVTVVVRKLDDLGRILDQAVTSGANQIHGISFGVESPDAALDEARKRAVADARHKAEIYSTAAGVGIGNIVTISEGGFSPPQPVVMAKAAPMQEAVPIAQGEQVISIDVNVTWEIK